MFLAPVVEPAAPELGAHLRGVLMESVHGVEYLGRARTEVQRLEHIGDNSDSYERQSSQLFSDIR